ncbi:MAG TPA: alpha/beta fold hydrolase [Terriglobales bacterium]|jgi:homoserine O-acetyltransferase
MKTAGIVLIACLLFASCAFAQEGQQQFASLGNFKLESGEAIRDCRIGYRTYGHLNADKSNAIVFLTWFGGNTEQLAGNFGPGRMVDTTKYFGISIDALGDGVSSSPSNSNLQPRMNFPQFTVRDMVNSQHQLLTQVLHISHIRAIFGISMGGMQVFQWIVSYPDFMDRAIPIMGTPRLAAYDLMHWQAEIDIITHDADWKNGEYSQNPARSALGEIGNLLLWTPSSYNRQTTREQALEQIEKLKTDPAFDANNHIRTAQAVMKLDVSGVYGSSMERAAAAVKAKVLVITDTYDLAVTPGEARAFAKLIHAEVLDLSGDCGHRANGCEGEKVGQAVAGFLDK